jgi:hypothetical protein
MFVFTELPTHCRRNFPTCSGANECRSAIWAFPSAPFSALNNLLPEFSRHFSRRYHFCTLFILLRNSVSHHFSVQMMLPDIFACSFAFLGIISPDGAHLSFLFLNDDEKIVHSRVSAQDGLLGMLASEHHPM